MEISNGRIGQIDPVRIFKKGSYKLVDILTDRVEGEHPIRIGIQHAENEEDAHQLRNAIEEHLQPGELILEEVLSLECIWGRELWAWHIPSVCRRWCGLHILGKLMVKRLMDPEA
jgi:hypothetical protein